MGYQCRWLVVKCDHIRRSSIAYVMSLFEYCCSTNQYGDIHWDGFLIKSTKMARIQIFSKKKIELNLPIYASFFDLNTGIATSPLIAWVRPDVIL